mmetsp:Transcript_23137/g.55805  ORF Transcript_23137/g.55805 Transcript_23137/m.55805 type:complete len:331 (+) Transcript_23137:398-1390(+)
MKKKQAPRRYLPLAVTTYARALLLAPRRTGEGRELASDVVDGDAVAAFPAGFLPPSFLAAASALPLADALDFLATSVLPPADDLALPAETLALPAETLALVGALAFRAGAAFFPPEADFALPFLGTAGEDSSEKSRSSSISSSAAFFFCVFFLDEDAVVLFFCAATPEIAEREEALLVTFTMTLLGTVTGVALFELFLTPLPPDPRGRLGGETSPSVMGESTKTSISFAPRFFPLPPSEGVFVLASCAADVVGRFFVPLCRGVFDRAPRTFFDDDGRFFPLPLGAPVATGERSASEADESSTLAMGENSPNPPSKSAGGDAAGGEGGECS